MIIAETKRLIISKFTTEDAPFYLKLVNTPHWIQYIGDRNIKTLDQAITALKEGNIKSYKDNGFGFYKLLLKDNNLKPIGTCGLIKRNTLDDVDIGFAMLPEYERKGFGYEASLEIIKLAKHKFNLKRIIAITLPNNKGSIALLEKLGLNYEKTVFPFDADEELLLFAKKLD
ncbi:GNAT family N-acetyltransferase [Pontimicrobium sp. MEBiC01747]